MKEKLRPSLIGREGLIFLHQHERVRTMGRIYLSSPHMGGKEKQYIEEAFETNWIAPLGPNVDAFEREVAKYVDVNAAAALSSGTAAIHLALKIVGVGPGDVVFCSSLTFAASCNPIIYQGATPIFIDSEPQSFNMSPVALEKAFKEHQPKAVIVVNLYGQSADMEAILEICHQHQVPVIEDAAESLGATYKGKMSGSLGDFGIFSFNGNKIITTSGGGMLVANDEKAINKVKFWATQSRENFRYYEHQELGYNYRMSNISAGIGRGQLEVLEERIHKKKEIYTIYQQTIGSSEFMQMMPVCEYGEPNYWLSVLILDERGMLTPLDIIKALEQENIESRHVWKPMHLQPLYEKEAFYNHYPSGMSVAEDLFRRGICLPSDTKMTMEDIQKVITIIQNLDQSKRQKLCIGI